MATVIETKTDEESGRQYSIYDDGTQKWSDSGRIKAPPPVHALTSERGRALMQIRKDRAILSQLRGLAQVIGTQLPPDAELEETITGAGNALEAITQHFGKTFLKSENLRGMAEGYRQLAAPLVGERPEPGTVNNTVNIFEMTDEQAAALIELRHRLHERQAGETVDGIVEGILAGRIGPSEVQHDEDNNA